MSFAINERILREHSSSASFERGVDYYQRGAVVSLERRGNLLTAEVEGSEYEPYRITVSFDEAGVTDAMCTCPYDYGGWCKHIVAMLLAYITEPDVVEEKPGLEALIATLSKEALEATLKHIAERHPEILTTLELYLALPQASPLPARRERQTTVDASLFRQLARSAVKSAEFDWDGNLEFDELYAVVDRVGPFLDQGDYKNALLILEAVTEAFFDEAGERDYEGYFYDEWLYEKLDAYWTEAVLGARLDDQEREALQEAITEWSEEVDSHGMSAFEMTDAALAQGWDYPPLVAVLRGDIGEAGAWPSREAVPEFADELAKIRLRILEREERYEEYLHLAQAEGQNSEYLGMLVKMGRVQEALAEAKEQLGLPSEALSLAKALREQGELHHALDIAEYGLTLNASSEDGLPSRGENKYHLAAWASELAEGLGAHQRALEAAVLAFEARPSFNDYQRVKDLAEASWPELKERLLASLRRSGGDAKVDIFLHEGLLDDAIAAVDDRSVYSDLAIRRVMAAVTNTHPDWVITTAQKLAEPIMNEGKAKYYDEAAAWLERARLAYAQAGRAEEWRRYLGKVKEKHARKYKLMASLKALER
jgi:uncharacterized Zn finger protein